MLDDGPDPLDRAALVNQWEVAFGGAPPPYLSLGFMAKALAYQAQCKRAGELPTPTRRVLEQIAAGRAAKDVAVNSTKPGTHYVREWNGRTYLVEVSNDGFEMDGRIWPSLSAIAKHITGTTWSGPRFFGLTRCRSAVQ
jgi:hypothetical protein